MCGIFGQLTPNGQADVLLIERMAHCLAHRGPDGFGSYQNTDGQLAFGAGRLAIIDLSAPAGPLFNEDRSVSVVFNGEIYNHKELRSSLEREGHHFRTRTDTEVIVHGYEQWGEAVFEHLRGMFAIGIWDDSAKRLLLARDRLGEKPLYYAHLGSTLIFASEIKALMLSSSLVPRVNRDALPYYLSIGYTPPPMTMFESVEKLAPGELLVATADNAITKRRYWTPHMEPTAHISYPDAVLQLRTLLNEVVEMRLMSDVPLGAFLSGGVDSSGIVALMSRILVRPVRTFTVGFDAPPDSVQDRKFNVDVHYANLASTHLKTDHQIIRIKQNEHLADLLPYLVYAMDEPISQHAITQTVFVAALARSCGVPVLLSGDGGDELFAGYPMYQADRVLERYLAIPHLLRRNVLDPILERMPARFDSARKLVEKSHDTDPVQRYLAWMRMIAPEEQSALVSQGLGTDAVKRISSILRPLLDRPKTRYFADRMAFTSLNLWLAEDSNMRVDKMSMAMSIESRAPMEDHRLVEFALSLPLEFKLRNGDVKSVLKAALADMLPAEILRRPKWGFAPPTSDWLRTIFRPLVDKYLSPERVAAVGWFNPSVVAQLVSEHMEKRRYQLWPVWTLLMFHLWHALYIEQDLTLDHSLRVADIVQRL